MPEIPVPASVTRLDLLDRVDYADAYAVDDPADRTPEEWMRAFLGRAPRWFQVGWVAGGTLLLGARFHPSRSNEYVLGWRVIPSDAGTFVIGLESLARVSVRLITVHEDGRALLATQVRLCTGYARRLWPGVERGHRYFAPRLLARAASTLAAR